MRSSGKVPFLQLVIQRYLVDHSQAMIMLKVKRSSVVVIVHPEIYLETTQILWKGDQTTITSKWPSPNQWWKWTSCLKITVPQRELRWNSMVKKLWAILSLDLPCQKWFHLVLITKKLMSSKFSKTILILLLKEEPESKENRWIKMQTVTRSNQLLLGIQIMLLELHQTTAILMPFRWDRKKQHHRCSREQLITLGLPHWERLILIWTKSLDQVWVQITSNSQTLVSLLPLKLC